eukprot:COSAG01_NODE_708_length_14125_cov_3.872745_12_plen_177_part_00
MGSVQLYSYSCTAMQLYGHTALAGPHVLRETVLKSIRRTLYSYHTGLDRHVKIRARSAVAVASPCTPGSRNSAGSRTQQQASDLLPLAASRRRCARGSPPCLLGPRSRGATTCHAEVCPPVFFDSALNNCNFRVCRDNDRIFLVNGLSIVIIYHMTCNSEIHNQCRESQGDILFHN